MPDSSGSSKAPRLPSSLFPSRRQLPTSNTSSKTLQVHANALERTSNYWLISLRGCHLSVGVHLPISLTPILPLLTLLLSRRPKRAFRLVLTGALALLHRGKRPGTIAENDTKPTAPFDL